MVHPPQCKGIDKRQYETQNRENEIGGKAANFFNQREITGQHNQKTDPIASATLEEGEGSRQDYGRYMDDFYLIHPSKEYLKYCLEVIRAYPEMWQRVKEEIL